MPEYENLKPKIVLKIYPVFQTFLKYKNYPSIISIKEKLKSSKFNFHEVDNEKIIKEIKPLKYPIFVSQLFKKRLMFLHIFQLSL